ncbi:MAG: tetratricopeptide repeat protein [Aggregatilineales bacterium]
MQIRRHSVRSRQQSPAPHRGGCLPFVAVLSMAAVVFFILRDFPAIFTFVNHTISSDSIHEATVAFTSGNLDETVRISQHLLAGDDTDVEALSLLVRALIYRSYVDYYYSADRKIALEVTGNMLVQLPDNVELIALHAYVLQVNGYSEEAIRKAQRVLLRDSENLPARLAISLAYASEGLFDAAVQQAERALTISTQSAPDWRIDALRTLAITYSDAGRYGDAVRMIRQGISINRRLIPLHFERALYALQTGDTGAATSAYFSVIAVDETNVKARLRLCELSSKLRETDTALQYCQDVTGRAPDWAEGWYFLGREYYLQGNFPQAQRALNQCSSLQVMQNIPIEERRFECWYLQGQAAEIQGDCQGLLTTYREFQRMASLAPLQETWIYPPEGPAICITPAVPTG